MRYFILIVVFFLNTHNVIGQQLHFDSSQYLFLRNSKPFNTIEDVLKLKQFKNKIVYIDIWGYGCAVCMKEFNYLPAVKSKYKGKSVAYLYLFYKTMDTLSEEVLHDYWMKYSIDKKLTGTHLLAYVIPPQQIKNDHIPTIRESQTITLDKDVYAIPRYMIADKSGKIIDFDAPRPDEIEKLFSIFNKLLKS